MRWLWKIVFVLISSLVLYAIFRSVPPAQLFNQSDKVGHALAFMLLAYSARAALPKLSSFWLWGTLLILAFVLEYLQGELRPLRVFSVEDVLANILGIVIAFTVVKFIRIKKPRINSEA